MIKPTPETIGNQIQMEVFNLYDSCASFLSPNSPQFTRIADKLNLLGKVDACRRSVIYVHLYTVCGDREQAEYYINNSRLIHADPIDIALAQLTLFANLGYYRESVPVLEYLSDPSLGQLRMLLLDPPGNGAFHLLKRMLDQALKMNLPDINENTSQIATAVKIMDLWGDSDDDYVGALEIAGDIMRERKLIHRDHMLTTPILHPGEEHDGYVKISYLVSVDLDTSIEMTCEYAERLALSGRKIPLSMIFEFEPPK